MQVSLSYFARTFALTGCRMIAFLDQGEDIYDEQLKVM